MVTAASHSCATAVRYCLSSCRLFKRKCCTVLLLLLSLLLLLLLLLSLLLLLLLLSSRDDEDSRVGSSREKSGLTPNEWVVPSAKSLFAAFDSCSFKRLAMWRTSDDGSCDAVCWSWGTDGTCWIACRCAGTCAALRSARCFDTHCLTVAICGMPRRVCLLREGPESGLNVGKGSKGNGFWPFALILYLDWAFMLRMKERKKKESERAFAGGACRQKWQLQTWKKIVGPETKGVRGKLWASSENALGQLQNFLTCKKEGKGKWLPFGKQFFLWSRLCRLAFRRYTPHTRLLGVVRLSFFPVSPIHNFFPVFSLFAIALFAINLITFKESWPKGNEFISCARHTHTKKPVQRQDSKFRIPTMHL